MRIGFVLPHIGPLAGPAAITRVARAVEDAGLDSVWVNERSLWPTDPINPYPLGTLPPVYKTVIDPLDALTFVAATTSHVLLGTSVLNLPWYNPLLLARRLTALDVLSGGRLVAGIGSGWSKDEHVAANSDWHTRGARSDEGIALLKAVWTTDPVEFAGVHYTVPRSYVSLKPVQQPHPPLVWGGWGPAAKKRAATVCDGWHPAGLPVAELAPQLAEVRALAAAAGRDPQQLRFIAKNGLELTDAPLGAGRAAFAGSPAEIAADLEVAQAAGVHDLCLDCLLAPDVDTVDDMVERVLAVARIAGRQGR